MTRYSKALITFSLLFPEEQWKDMKRESHPSTWTAEIKLKPGATHIDLFTNHRKTIHRQSKTYPTDISSP